MRIGILLTPYKEQQIEKEQYVKISKRSWLSTLEDKNTITVKNKKFATDDLSIFMYLKKNFGEKHTFLPIYGDDNNIKSKIEKCDIVFLLIFDILEAYHTHTKKDFYKMKTIFKSPNVFPPYDYQDLINHKNKYYDYLEKNDINVLPFVYISSREIKNNLKGCLKKIGKLKPGNDGKFIGKPIYGQESIDYKEFDENTKPYIIIKYLEKIATLYTGCIFQPFRHGYNKIGEYRVFFIGDKIIYCIRTITIGQKFTYTRVTEKNDGRVGEIFEFCKEIFQHLPSFSLRGKTIPKLLTRMDITCCNNRDYFVSELEFVPSLYCDRVDHLFIDRKLGDQIIEIINQTEQIKKEKNLKKINFKTIFK